MKKKLLRMAALLLVICLVPVSSFAVTKIGGRVILSEEEYARYQQFDKLLELLDMAEYYFYKDVDVNALLEGAAAGLLTGLGDPYSFYYTPEDYAAMWEDDEGAYAGVGMQIQGNYVTGICTITRVFENSPAMEAGVRKKDILYKVEDLYVNAQNLTEAVNIMRGTPGEPVNVTFIRNGEELQLTMIRAVVNVNQVESCMLDDKIGLIRLYEFAGTSGEQFCSHLDKLVQAGCEGLIIDLRDNPGGWVDIAKTIADRFLDEGILCTLRNKDGVLEVDRTTKGKLDMKLVMLVNENSASSSEILTGALRDRAGAKVVGINTFGKGIVQIVQPVSNDGSGMQITIAEYYLPSDVCIHKVGIAPDVEIDMPEDDDGLYEFGDLSDVQLNTAYEVLREEMGLTAEQLPAA